MRVSLKQTGWMLICQERGPNGSDERGGQYRSSANNNWSIIHLLRRIYNNY